MVFVSSVVVVAVVVVVVAVVIVSGTKKLITEFRRNLPHNSKQKNVLNRLSGSVLQFKVHLGSVSVFFGANGGLRVHYFGRKRPKSVAAEERFRCRRPKLIF